jgi:hypothetical protein
MTCPCGEKMKLNSDINDDDMYLICPGCGYFERRQEPDVDIDYD